MKNCNERYISCVNSSIRARVPCILPYYIHKSGPIKPATNIPVLHIYSQYENQFSPPPRLHTQEYWGTGGRGGGVNIENQN